MLIELPQVEYSMADCQDLFISTVDDDYDDIDRFNPSLAKNDDRLTVPQVRGVQGHISDAEPFVYTSSSESDADMCFSDIEPPRGTPSGQNGYSAMPPSESTTTQKDLALHSPGQLLGTPRDPSRRYEYPFPAHLREGQFGTDFTDGGSSSSSSSTSTPGITPGEGSSLGLVALAATLTAGIDTASRLASLRMCLPAPAPTPVPVPVPIEIPAQTSVNVPGPSSAPAQSIYSSSNMFMNTGGGGNPSPGSSSIAAHPKLSRFNPANTPVPPGLRGRTRKRKSASVSIPSTPRQQHQGMVASVSIPASVSAVAAASAVQMVAISAAATSAVTVVSPATVVKRP